MKQIAHEKKYLPSVGGNGDGYGRVGVRIVIYSDCIL